MNPEKSPGIETLLPVPVPRRAMIPLTVLIDGRGDSMRVRVECCLLSRGTRLEQPLPAEDPVRVATVNVRAFSGDAPCWWSPSRS